MNNEKRVQRKATEKPYKRFTGNKTEGQGFADKRKRKIQHEYHKLLKKEKKSSTRNTKHLSVLEELSDEEVPATDKSVARGRSSQKAVGTYTKAHHEFKQKKREKERKKQEAKEKKQAMDTAIEKYHQKKQSNYKLLCKKTARGQPVMKHQIDYLLEKIKKQKSQT